MAHLFDALPPPQVEVSAADARGAATPDAFRPKLGTRVATARARAGASSPAQPIRCVFVPATGEKKKAPADPFASLAKLG